MKKSVCRNLNALSLRHLYYSIEILTNYEQTLKNVLNSTKKRKATKKTCTKRTNEERKVA